MRDRRGEKEQRYNLPRSALKASDHSEKGVITSAARDLLSPRAYHAREKRLPVFPVTLRSEPLTPASCSSFRANSHRRSESRFT